MLVLARRGPGSAPHQKHGDEIEQTVLEPSALCRCCSSKGLSLTIRIILVGLMMGAAEVVPGVSGGTIAFVFGLYDRLVHAIQHFNPVRLCALRKLSIAQLWAQLDISLLLLFGPMFVAILSLAQGVGYLLEYHPILIWSFFFGLVLASVYSVGRKLKPFNIEVVMAMACGVMVGVIVTHMCRLKQTLHR